MTLLTSSADSLEEVVGLDVGYTGGALHRRLHGKGIDDDQNFSEYLDEYVHRRRERAFLKNSSGHIPASSVHNLSLHGNSYHGRKVITPAMKEEAMSNGSLRGKRSVSNSSLRDSVVSNSSGGGGGGPPPSLTSVREENDV